MLIKVFGHWINPSIVALALDQGKDCSLWCASGESALVIIENKTADEVAAEINRQIKGE